MVSANYSLLDNETAQAYLAQGATNETMADLFFALNERPIEKKLKPSGLNIEWPPLDPIDYYFVITARNAEGVSEATRAEILINK